jgi:hypothetical protein
MTAQQRALAVGDRVRDNVSHREGEVVYSDPELEIVGVRWEDAKVSLPVRTVDVDRVVRRS